MIRIIKGCALVCAFLLCCAQARTVKSKRRYSSEISRFRGCGSQMIDALRFMCQSTMWKPDNCKKAKKLFCRNRSFSTHPICHFNCKSAISNQNLNVNFSSNGVNVSKTSPGNGIPARDVKVMLQYFLDRSTNRQGRAPTVSRSRTKRRSQRNRCCRTSCSISVLADLCNTAT